MSKITYKVFLSHNSSDKDQVEDIAQYLEKNGIKVWFDKWNIAPGTRWVQELEKGLDKCSAILIFFGAHGMGPWHTAEGEIAINHAIEKNKPVIPVLLPN